MKIGMGSSEAEFKAFGFMITLCEIIAFEEENSFHKC
jgi:hypothetical protein